MTNLSLNPLEAAAAVRRSYIEYLTTRHAPKGSDLEAEFAERLRESSALTSGPFLQGAIPFRAGSSVQDLLADGVLHPEISAIDSDAFPLGRPLYLHQEHAIRKLRAGRNLIVATGTGSGKTESFLIPIIDHLMRERDAGTLGQPGVRALLLYPMNALANDQLGRIRDLVRALPDVTFGRFVGDTRERFTDAVETHRQRFGTDPLPNELISREQMRATPPNILLTNYAMLEYLLLRPEDTTLFDGPSGEHWKYVVLDEVHVYSGAQGAEIAMLLRRLRQRVAQDHKPLQFVGTSATLGSGPAAFPELADFASKLFDAEVAPTGLNGGLDGDIISPWREELSSTSTWRISEAAITECLDAVVRGGVGLEHVEMISAAGAPSIRSDEEPFQYLGRALCEEELTVQILKSLASSSRTPHDIAQFMPGDAVSATAVTGLVDLASRCTRPGTKTPVVPARYHFMLRALEGAFLCVAPDHPAASPRLRLSRAEFCQPCSLAGRQRRLFEAGACQKCGISYIVGQEVDHDGATHLEHAGLFDDNVINLLLDLPSDEEDDDEAGAAPEASNDVEHRKVCTECGMLAEGSSTACGCQAPVRDVTVGRSTERGEPMRKCVSCNGVSQGPVVSRFLSGQDAPVSVIAAALYQQLPPVAHSSLGAKVGEGRKLLLFSDSRQDAAFFAPYLDRTYSRAVERRLIWRELEALGDPAPRFEDLVVRLRDSAIAAKVLNSEQSLTTNDTLVRHWLTREVISTDRRQSLDGVGLADISVAPPSSLEIPAIFSKLGFSDAEALDLALTLLDSLRRQAIIWLPAGVDITNQMFAPRNLVQQVRRDGPANKVRSWVPPKNLNTRLDYLRKVFEKRGIADDPHEFLGGIWDHWLASPDHAWLSGPIRSSHDARHGTVFALNHEWIQFRKAGSSCIARVCERCKQVAWRSVSDVCPTWRCSGTLRPWDANDSESDHYRSLYTTLAPIGMAVEEHTGQLANDTASDIQRNFINGDINVLSCSTTFELGVDVGDVQAVLMRNVPPAAANYVQRAGRAGRRAGSPTLIVTFAQRRSHDLYFFQQPHVMIDGHVATPTVALDNIQIARRHLHAIAFAAYERHVVENGGSAHRDVGSFFVSTPEQPSAADQFEEWLRTRPLDVVNAANEVCPDSLKRELGTATGKWIDELFNENNTTQAGWFSRARNDALGDLSEVSTRYDEVDNMMKDAFKAGDTAKAQRVSRLLPILLKQIDTLQKKHLLNFLAQRVVLPKYGFPVDVVTLDVSRSGSHRASTVDLSRDLRVAISDYAPGSRVVASKALWEPTGIRIPPGRSLFDYHHATCASCGAFRANFATAIETCVVCSSTENKTAGVFTSPVFGFVGKESDDKPGESRPERMGMSEFYFSNFLSDTPPEFVPVDATGGTVRARFSKQGEITVLNRGPHGRGFRVCYSCGFAEPTPRHRRRARRDENAFPPHRRPSSPDTECSGRLEHRALGHQYLTDVVEVAFPRELSPIEAWSTLFALLAGTKGIGITRDDVNGTLRHGTDRGGPTMVLFDAVPGGAGHVRRLMERFDELLHHALQVAENCECGEDTSCYGCLRTYGNQRYHEQLRRDAASGALRGLLNLSQ